MVRALVASGGASTTLASSIAYQPFGPLASLTQGNGLTLNRSYDGNYWLSGVTLSGSAGTLLGLAITRDANGKVTAVSDSAAPLRNASYSYTDAGRLAAASGTWGADSYTWDANDNRTRADRTLGGIGSGTTASDVATLAPGTNRLAELKDGAGVVSRSFAHTPGGDTATITRPAAPTLAYSYDARGRLSSVMSGAAQIASYAYDWRDQRVSASSAEVGARHYLYAEDGQLLAEHDAATGALLREYVWLDTMPLAMVSGAVSTPTYTWITTGNLNEPLLLTNAAGAVTASTTRDPWGNPILLAGGQPLDLGYPGQWQDASTGLSQNWHRDYDPTLGRYIEADPLGLGGGSNLFAYVGGDPVNAVDPMGLETYWEHYTGLPDSYRQDAINSIAGWSDSYTFGGTYYLRELLGANKDVRVCDPWYLGDSLVGLISPRGATRTVTRWFRTGREFKVGPVRIAPFGNRNPNWRAPPHPKGRFPHYHVPGPKRPDGSRAPGHSPGRHRPWDKSPRDKSWKDRFWPW